jgi:cytochrome c-type biogenesis protein CcmH/NrfF
VSASARGSLAALLAIALMSVALVSTRGVEAQTPTPPPPAPTPAATPTDAQVLAVEHQLLCPLCVNERLDVCTLAICNDMKQIVRDRLAQGATSDEIISFFEARYGPKVRAELPRTGFNLLLFGWVGGALLVTAVAAALVLTSMRRATIQHEAAMAHAAAAPDDADLDALINEAEHEELDADERGSR